MPQAAAAAVAGAVGTAGATAAVTALAYVATYAATVYAMNKAMQSLARKPGKSGAGSGLEISVIDSTADGRVIYGTIRTGGVNVIPAITSNSDVSSDDNGAILNQILAFAVHECASFGSVYLDDDEVVDADIHAITGAATDGRIEGTSKYKHAAWLRRYRGTTTQNVDFRLNQDFPVNFTSAFRGRGIAYLAASFDWGKGKVFTGGAPNISAIISGRICYDPRLDSSPGADPTNPAYAAHTSCPALVWADYKMSPLYGQKLSANDIDWDCVVAAANVCDATVTTPSGSQPRYTFNGILSTAEDTADNEKDIIDSMMGKFAISSGKHRIFAGAWRSAEFAIQQGDWVSIGAIQATGSRNETRFNGVVCYHVDPARKWQRVEAYRRYNDTYKSADAGERLWVEMDQPACLSTYEAQRKSEFLLRQSRNGIKVSGTLPPRFMKIRTWDNVTVTFEDLGWVSKTFTVATCTPRPDGAVDVVLLEEQDTDWADLSDGEYGTPSTSSIPATNPTKPSEPENLAITSQPGAITARWDEPVTLPLGTRYRLIQASSPGDATLGSVVWDGDIRNATINVADPFTKFYWAQAYTNSYSSFYSPNTLGVLGRGLPVDDATFSQRIFVDEEFQYDAGSRHWWIGTPGLTGAGSSAILFNLGLSADRGILRNYFASANSVSITRAVPKRSPPQTFVANQVYGFAVRFMKATNVTSGRIILSTLGVNSAWAFTPENVAANFQAQRADIRDIVDIAIGGLTGSYWYVAQGHLLAPNSSFPNFPYLGSLVQVAAKNGVVDIDRVAMWVANSTAGTGSYYIL